ncbi:MAG: L-seryl-tRNA(Sec) selenium transferase [Synergistaceae bacterium]|nr:L-seryl-tRNA(Sec) selenium transferase [Synergistaceae bacterium]
MDAKIQTVMRKIPSMDRLLALPWVAEYEEKLGRETVKFLLSEMLAALRAKIIKDADTAFDAETIEAEARALLQRKAAPGLRRVVNATGVVIHTNLGRSLLADEAVKEVCAVAGAYNTLEYSLDEGKRGNRNDHVEWLLCRLTGAEAALVVNNNAAAVILALSALAKDKESIVSRGELVEIGGSFRIPDIMALSGTKMVEIGTTNRTHLGDYEKAIGEECAMLLKIHPSNYRITGFHSAVPREELAELAHARGLILMEDLGSGMLIDASAAGLSSENDPTVAESLRAGCDIVTFSGDKLLGGPQIGAIVGKKELIARLKSHQLLRALRVDKMTLAAFEATLRLYLRGDYSAVPTVEMIFKKEDELRAAAMRFSRGLKNFFKKTRIRRFSIEAVPVKDTVGGGSFPQSELPGFAVALRLPEMGSAGKLAERLRSAASPVIAGAAEDRLLFHMRTLRPGDEKRIIAALDEILYMPAEKAH